MTKLTESKTRMIFAADTPGAFAAPRETHPSGVDKPVHSKKNRLNDADEYRNTRTHL